MTFHCVTKHLQYMLKPSPKNPPLSLNPVDGTLPRLRCIGAYYRLRMQARTYSLTVASFQIWLGYCRENRGPFMHDVDLTLVEIVDLFRIYIEF